MKKLYLIRHAKSSWGNAALKDYDRPLNQRGIWSVEIMRDHIENQGVTPDLILFSTAKRTIETMLGICKNLSENIIREGRKEMYGASKSEIETIISKTSKNVNCLFYIGHNPGITDAVNYFCNEEIPNVPTLGIAEIEFEMESWEEIFRGTGTLKSFVYPKKINPNLMD